MYLVFIKAIGKNKIIPSELANWLVGEGMGEIVGRVVS